MAEAPAIDVAVRPRIEWPEQPETQPFGKLAGALAKAQAAYPAIPRDRTVTIRPRDKAPYSFDYAPLDTILNAVRGPLSSNGLAVTQILDGSNLVTLLLHESGEFLRSSLPVPRGEGMQEFGAKITYLRRYALQSLLGVAAEDDNDAGLEPGAPATASPRLAAAVQDRQPKTAADGKAEAERMLDHVAASRPPRVEDQGRADPERLRQAGIAVATIVHPPAVVNSTPEAEPETGPAAEEPVGDEDGEDGEEEVESTPDPSVGVTPLEAEILASTPDKTGLTMDEFRKLSREKHYLTGFVTGVARDIFKDRQPPFDLVQNLSDEERFLLWLACIANS